MRGRCWRLSSRADSMTASATESSPETRGNPLALLELPRGLTPRRAGRWLHASRRGQPAGSARGPISAPIQDLPEATQRLMLLAAADPTGDATLVWRAAQVLGVGVDAVSARGQASSYSRSERGCGSAIRSCDGGLSRRDRGRIDEPLTPRSRSRPIGTSIPIGEPGIERTRRAPGPGRG